MIKVGIIGTGEMGRVHAHCLIGMKCDAEIIACHDINHEAAKDFSIAFGSTPYQKIEEFMDSEIDCVYICTRHDSHKTLVELAIKNKKAVFCEKPLAFDLNEAESLYLDVVKSGLNFTIGFNQRFAPGIIALKTYMKENKTVPTIINMSMSCVNFLDGWMGKPEQGGGIVLSWLCHGMDLLRHITDDEIISLCCNASRQRLPEGYCADGGAIICNMKSGAIATISFHDHSPMTYVMDPQKDMVRIEMHTGEESLVCYGHDKFVACHKDGVETQTFGPYNQLYSWGYIEFNKQYIEALKKGVSLSPDIKDAIISSIMLDKVHQSIAEQRFVGIDLDRILK